MVTKRPSFKPQSKLILDLPRIEYVEILLIS